MNRKRTDVVDMKERELKETNSLIYYATQSKVRVDLETEKKKSTTAYHKMLCESCVCVFR